MSRILLSNIQQLVALLDVDGRVLEINDAALNSAGLAKDEADGKFLWQLAFWQPGDCARIREAVQKAAAQGRQNLELDVATPAARIIELRIDQARNAPPGTRYLIAEARDITEEKRAAREYAELYRSEQAERAKTESALKALSESEKQYREMGEAIPYGVWLCGPDGGARYVSPSFLELLDMTLKEQNQFGWVKRMDPAEVEPFMEKWMRCVNTGEFWDSEHRLRDRNGEYHTVLTRGRPVRDENGVITSWVGINLDITERKRMEVELKQAKEAAEQANQTKARFFANVSHELRTPLTLILAPVRNLLSSPSLSESQRAALHVVERNALMLLKQVNDLLDIARLDVGRMETRYAEIDLGHMARLVASNFETLAVDRHIRFVRDLDATMFAQVDPEKVQRILLNLLSNAFKFTPEDGTVEVRLEREHDGAVLVVQDTGPGIRAEAREAVFERFQQVHEGGTRLHGGTGLGLAIVKEFVDLHGGSVSVTDAPGGGALFRVELPLLAPAGTQVRPAENELNEDVVQQSLVEFHGQGRQAAAIASEQGLAPLILIVEDNPDMNAFLCQSFGAQYQIAQAFDGATGLAKARELMPDLIVSDIMMPRMSGDEMIRELRKDPRFDAVPALVLTAKADDELRVTLLKEGVQDYLGKPFSAEELLARAERLIREKKRMEDTMRTSYLLLRSVADGVEDAIYVKDRAGRFELINRAGAALLGKRPEEIVGTTVDEIASVGTAALAIESDREALSGRTATYETSVASARGHRTLLVTKSPRRSREGEIVGVIGIARDITDRKEAELRIMQLNRDLDRRVEELQSVLSEKDTLLREVQHRVKNNLQVISSLLSLEAARVEDQTARDKLLESRNRVRSMGLIHEKLTYAGTTARVDFAEYVQDLTRFLLDSQDGHGAAVQVHANVDVSLALDEAVPCGLIIHELIANSLEHAFPDGRQGEIWLEFHRRGGEIELRYRDNGVGLPPGFDIHTTQTLGLQLVTDLAGQLGGHIAQGTGSGASFDLRFRSRKGIH